MVVITPHRHDLRGIIFRHHATATAHARARPPSLARLLPVFLAESEAVTCVHCIGATAIGSAEREWCESLRVNLLERVELQQRFKLFQLS